MYFIVLLFLLLGRSQQQSLAPARSSRHYGTCPVAAAACLLASAGFLFRSRVEKKLAHLARRIAGDGTLARPRECLVHIGGFQYPETAYVLLGLSVRPIGDEHRTIRLLPHRLCVGGRGDSAGELPHASSNQFAVERLDLLDHCFGYGGRVEVVGKVASNQILRHEVSFNGLCVGRLICFHYIRRTTGPKFDKLSKKILQPVLCSFLRTGPSMRRPIPVKS